MVAIIILYHGHSLNPGLLPRFIAWLGGQWPDSTLLSCGSARESTFLPTSVPLAKPNGSMKRLVQSFKITVLQVRSDRVFSEEFMSSDFEAVIAFARK